MAMKRNILGDPRWHEFMFKYRDNIEKFGLEVCGNTLSDQQQLVADCVARTGSRTSVSSGTGTGKSALVAMIALNFITTHPKARCQITATKIMQVQIGVFKYIKTYWEVATRAYPWLDDYFCLTDTSFYAKGRANKGVWEIVMKGFKVGSEEALAGEHAKHQLYIVDEASGLNDKAFAAITGTLTEKNNRLVLLSQPTRTHGFFYQTHHSLRASDPLNPEKGRYAAITLNSEESPFVDDDYIISKFIEYGGRDSPEYMVRVRGLFPDTLDGNLISRKQFNRGLEAIVELPEGWGWVASADVSAGEFRDKSELVIAKVFDDGERRLVKCVSKHTAPRDMGAVDFARFIHERVAELPNVKVGIDGGGVGREAVREAEKLGLDVQKILWGKPPFSDEHKDRFKLERDLASVSVRDGLRFNTLELPPFANKQELEDMAFQFTHLPFSFNEKMQYSMMPKEKMKSEGIDSPDAFDAIAQIYLMEYYPSGEGEDIEDLEDEMDDAFEQAGLAGMAAKLGLVSEWGYSEKNQKDTFVVSHGKLNVFISHPSIRMSWSEGSTNVLSRL